MQSIRVVILIRSKDQIMLSHFLDNVKYSFTRNVKKLSNNESFGVYINYKICWRIKGFIRGDYDNFLEGTKEHDKEDI